MNSVRELTGSDAESFRHIRLEALRLHPYVFASSVEAETKKPLAIFRKRAARGGYFGGFVDEHLMGMARFSVAEEPRTRHKGTIGGVYVRASARSNGLAEAIMNVVIEHARLSVELIQLSVALPNDRAVRFYERLGFRTYGTEMSAMKIGDAYIDEVLMVRFL